MPGFCPFDLERKPCGEHACNLYRQVFWQNAQGEAKESWDCVFVHSMSLHMKAIQEQVASTATMDKVAAGLHRGFGGLLELAGAAAKARALNGGA